ncbi:MAG: hypothetical protein QXO76_00255 [Thermoproteota archaeon]
MKRVYFGLFCYIAVAFCYASLAYGNGGTVYIPYDGYNKSMRQPYRHYSSQAPSYPQYPYYPPPYPQSYYYYPPYPQAQVQQYYPSYPQPQPQPQQPQQQKVRFYVQPGSLKENLKELLKANGWRTPEGEWWNSRHDYTIAEGFSVSADNIFEAVDRILSSFPLSARFYTLDSTVQIVETER